MRKQSIPGLPSFRGWPGVEAKASPTLALSVTEEVSLEIRYRIVKRAATLATGPRPQKLAADRDS